MTSASAEQVQVKQQELEFGKWSLASRQSKEGRLAPLALLLPISTSLRAEEAFDRIILTNYYRTLLRKVAECLNAVEPSEIEPTTGRKNLRKQRLMLTRTSLQ